MRSMLNPRMKAVWSIRNRIYENTQMSLLLLLKAQMILDQSPDHFTVPSLMRIPVASVSMRKEHSCSVVTHG